MNTAQIFEDEEFWSEECDGRSIAIFNHHGEWLAYLDHVLQDVVFATPEDAVMWLTDRINRGVPARLN